MKKNTKFLLMYIAILFSFALVLILFAGLTQNNYAKELAESQGIKQNLVEITEQYQTLTDSMKVINKQLEEAKLEITDYKQQITKLTSENEITKTLIEALELHEDGKNEEAAEKISSIDKEALTEAQLYIYNKIN
ncbi:MAG: hypothetical protein IJ460_08525 [Clostridia bacterium]|nr:hypothetical protein [Clostridia bacterium]